MQFHIGQGIYKIRLTLKSLKNAEHILDQLNNVYEIYSHHKY